MEPRIRALGESIFKPQPVEPPDIESSLTITTEKVQEWVKEMGEISRRIELDRIRLEVLNRRIEAVHLLLNADQDGQLPTGFPLNQESSNRKPLKEYSPVEIVLYFLSQFSTETTITYLRDTIEKSGYPVEQFGRNFRYYYTILSRLEKSEKIVRDGDKIMLKK